MNDSNIERMSLNEALLRRGKNRTDWDRLRKQQVAEFEPAADPDEGEFDDSKARVVVPGRKQAISVRLDTDILEFFKAGGPGYQTRINAALRMYMNSRPASPAGVPAPSRGFGPAGTRSRAPGWDSKAIAETAKQKYGNFTKLFEAHNWPERGRDMMPRVQSRVKQTYGSVAEFVRYHGG